MQSGLLTGLRHQLQVHMHTFELAKYINKYETKDLHGGLVKQSYKCKLTK